MYLWVRVTGPTSPYKSKTAPTVTPLCSTASLFGLDAILKQRHWMTPNWWHWTLQLQRYTICTCRCVPGVSKSRIAASFALQNYNPPFCVRKATLRKVQLMTPKWLEHCKGKRTPYTFYWYPEAQKFGSVPPKTSRFRVTGHFETCAPNDTKRTSNTTRSKVPHVCVTSVHEWRIY